MNRNFLKMTVASTGENEITREEFS
jgi:hypothetical protein